MRIVAGRFRGRAIQTPFGDGIRPTSDRLRETIFNVIAHRHRATLEDGRVLDLFAGTGALGLEAMSRGASFACFVDEGAEARGLLRANVETFGLGGVTRILRRDATKLGEVAPFEPFDLVFLDPPYGKGLGERALVSALAGGWLARDCLIVFEERATVQIALPEAFSVFDRREAGEGQIVMATLIG